MVLSAPLVLQLHFTEAGEMHEERSKLQAGLPGVNLQETRQISPSATHLLAFLTAHLQHHWPGHCSSPSWVSDHRCCLSGCVSSPLCLSDNLAWGTVMGSLPKGWAKPKVKHRTTPHSTKAALLAPALQRNSHESRELHGLWKSPKQLKVLHSSKIYSENRV